MNAYRNGEKIVVCDGCHRPIIDYKSPYNDVAGTKKTRWGRVTHACSTACVKKIKANPPNEQRCPTCGIRVASGALVCMNNHPTDLAQRIKGVKVRAGSDG